MFYSHEGTATILTRPREVAPTDASSSPHLAQIWRRNRLVCILLHSHAAYASSVPRRPLLTPTPHRLVATLGSKSNLKKVSRKAILDVDVSKTCDTIIEPVAPMALRLSSNLLCVSSHTRIQGRID